MMAMNRMGTSPHEIYDDHPSLSASLEDFEHADRSPVFGLPSQHSGFKSEESQSESESEEPVSEEPWSPPAWRQQNAAGGWYRHQPYPQDKSAFKSSVSASRSRGTSPKYESAHEEEGDITVPANIPLPRGSMSPVKEQSPSPSLPPEKEQEAGQNFEEIEETVPVSGNPDNYFRFAMRAEVQQRTEPIEAALAWIRSYSAHVCKSWTSFSSTLLMLFFAYSLLSLVTHTPTQPPVPDLVKVAGLARNFEPLIFYSENGVRQIGDLQETGVAVWDLGESVRFANMTSAPLIVSALDSLSESLKNLAIELTKFFANVDGDIDSILIVMDWAKRELSAVSSQPSSSLGSAFTNIHTLLSHVGILQDPSTGTPTRFGKMVTTIFGATHTQRTSQTLHRTFNEFLNVLEESINAELLHSHNLFALFENIDRQFENLQRTASRELDTQERLEAEFLSKLWTRMVGPNQALMRKYEKNKQLLASVRQRTTHNKAILMEHNNKLEALKGNLETLRRKLVSPLVRRGESSSLGMEEQVKGLEGTYEYLKRARESQKGRVLEVLYGAASSRRSSIGREGGGVGQIEAM